MRNKVSSRKRLPRVPHERPDCLLLHLDFHLRVGPAAHEAASSFARPIVGDDMENVVTGFAEGCGCDGLAVEDGIVGRGEFRFLQSRGADSRR